MLIAHAWRVLASGEEMRCLARQQADRTIEQRHIDMLAAPGSFAHCQRGLDTDHGIKPAGQVRDRNAHLHRLARGFAGQRHEAAHRLDDEIIARFMRARPGLAETGDRAIDETLVGRGKAGVIEPELGQRPGLEVFEHHIGRSGEIAHPRKIVLILEIGHDRALPAIGGVVIGRLALAIPTLDPWRAPQPRPVPLGAFDLDYIRAEIGENLSGPRPCQDAREFEDLQSGERSLRVARLIEPHGLRLAQP